MGAAAADPRDALALILPNHIDAVSADLRYWTVNPFRGEVRDGYVCGVVRSMGAGWLIGHRPELFRNAGYLLDEGGSGSRIGEDVVFSIEVTQKVPLWLRATARGNPGHGSTPQTATAVTRLLRAGDRVAQTAFPPRVIPAVQAMFEGMAPFQPAELRGRYANMAAAIGDDEFLRYLQLTNPGAHAPLRNTCSITRLEGSDKINVVPGISTGFTDSRFFRDMGSASYGFSAFVTPLADRRGVHGNDERIGIDTLIEGTAFLIELVDRYATGRAR